MEISEPERELLQASAEAASQRAYCPYSGCRVGAAEMTAASRIYSACNVENVSYGLTICAERRAVFQAVAAGEQRFSAIALYTATPNATPPCGACRQVIHEFAPRAWILSFCAGGESLAFRL